MAIPAEVANDALNVMLAVIQTLMKRCIKVKDSNPKALRLSDEIARHSTQAKDLKLYSGDATSFSPQLLSFAAVMRQYSKGGAFENVPNWTSVTNDDPQIKSHPRFEKTMDYYPPSTLDIPAIPTVTDIPATVPTTPTLIVPPLTASTPPSMPSHMDPGIITKPVAEPKQWVYRHLYFPEAEREQWKVAFAASDSKKRKAEDEDTDGAIAVANKKRKLMSDVNKEPTGGLPLQKVAPVTTDKDAPLVAAKSFQDSETQPAEWGSDSDVATPWQCNKCAKLDIACLVLPDKKFGHTCLACANCDTMKITCAIDGVGVWQRLQGKAAKASSDAPKCPHTPKSQAISQTLAVHPSRSQWSIVIDEGVEQKPMEPEHGQSSVPANLRKLEPTSRDILQGIQDLGRRLDLLAANEQVEALEVRVGSVETNLLKRLDKLEQWLNESDAWWNSLKSLG
ncbi:hypothetical protein BDR06DRAFT_1013640 [Suillus hirtellus]|nr:hypothetical protein BDR06DRAFT_1013640 [Suillus hirtellus]